MNFEKNKEAVFRVIAGMKQLLDKEGIDFKVFMIPVHFKGHGDFDNYPLENMHREIMAALTASGIDAKDLLADYRLQENSPDYYYFDDMWHPTPEGHELIAAQLVEWMKTSQ